MMLQAVVSMSGNACQTCLTRSTAVHRIGAVWGIRMRKMSSVKRFYQNVTVSQSDGGFEVILGKAKLKTPMGSLFKVPNEALALAVANEWQAQTDVIKRHTMHLTNLCNTAIDNPTERPRDVVINGILEFLATDTLCYRLTEPPQLAELQRKEWDPLIDWVKERYGVVVQPTSGIAVPDVSNEALAAFRQHLNSHSNWALVGYQSAVQILQSLILTSALLDRYLTVEKALSLSRLEQEFQISQWGNVEWQHDVDVFELRARLAAATLLVHLNSETTTIKTKSQIPRLGM